MYRLRWPKGTLLAVASGILLALPFLNPNLYGAAWISFVPLLYGIRGQSLKSCYGLGAICGFVYYAMITYWITDFITLLKGYGIFASTLLSWFFWVFCAQLLACLTVFFALIRRYSATSDLVAFPLVVIVAFALYPMLFSVQLGEGQSEFLWAIQAADLFGVHGLDGLIALVNVLIYRLLCGFESRPQQRVLTLGSAIAWAMVGCWFVYGAYYLSYWDQKVEQWPLAKVGVVQPNEAPMLAALPMLNGYSRTYPPELDMTERLVSAGAQWVIWPEARYKGYLDSPRIQSAFSESINRLDVHLIFQDMKTVVHPTGNAAKTAYKNVAVYVGPSGETVETHEKNKLVVFGEYIPFVHWSPKLTAFLESYWGRFTSNIVAGTDQRHFTSGAFDVVPLICNETMYPQFVGSAVGEGGTQMLVGLSSNGWFGKSIQPYQHTYTSVLRAVEARAPFVHALNNGPSLAVLPSGRRLFQADYHQAGGYLVSVPYSPTKQSTWFSGHSNLFLLLSYLGLLVLVFRCVFGSAWRRKKSANTSAVF